MFISRRKKRPTIPGRISICVLGWLFSTLPGAAQGPAEPIAESYDLRFELRPGAKRSFAKGWTQIPLEPSDDATLEGNLVEGRLSLGARSDEERAFDVVLACRARGKSYKTLRISRASGVPEYEKVVSGHVEKFGIGFRTSFQVSLPIPHRVGERTVWRDFPILLWFETRTRRERPTSLRYRQRGVATAEIEIHGFAYDVALADGNQDGRFEGVDWWTLQPAVTTVPRARRVRELAHARGYAWKLELLDTLGEAGRLVRYEAREGGDPSRDPRRKDRLAPRAAVPLPFTNQVESAVEAAIGRGKPYFIYFATDWCIPCRQMEAFVYTAQAVVSAAEGVVCIKVGESADKLRRRHLVTSYPTGVLFHPDGTEIDRFRGYRGVRQMVAFFEKARSTAYPSNDSEDGR